eukprot:8730096-Alexandrium_andersonii.AAC.1
MVVISSAARRIDPFQRTPARTRRLPKGDQSLSKRAAEFLTARALRLCAAVARSSERTDSALLFFVSRALALM